jgi:hypothetical protein
MIAHRFSAQCQQTSSCHAAIQQRYAACACRSFGCHISYLMSCQQAWCQPGRAYMSADQTELDRQRTSTRSLLVQQQIRQGSVVKRTMEGHVQWPVPASHVPALVWQAHGAVWVQVLAVNTQPGSEAARLRGHQGLMQTLWRLVWA